MRAIESSDDEEGENRSQDGFEEEASDMSDHEMEEDELVEEKGATNRD